MTMESGDLPLEEALQFQPHSFQEGLNPFSSPTRPVGSGISWLASNGTGLIARVTLPTKILILHEQQPLDSSHQLVELQVITTTAGIVRLAFQQSLLVVAQNDGSMECYNILPDTHSLRWRVSNVHSFVSSEVDKPLSSSRDWGASAAGPLVSLELNSWHQLLLADAGTQHAVVYNAAESAPSALVVVAGGATCATWISKDIVAVGKKMGEIEVYSVANQSSELLKSWATPADDGFCCTYLACHNASTLIVGFCSVLTGDDHDDEDEDDTAEHIVNMFLVSLEDNTPTSEWADIGNVVPFFSVPRNGRHVFYTQFIDNILVVGTNVGSDLALVYMPDLTLLELTEGAGATTPTTEEDDYTFCVGLATLGRLLYISATDGSLTCLQLLHSGNHNYFKAPELPPLQPVPIQPCMVAQPAAPSSPSTGSSLKTLTLSETAVAFQRTGFGQTTTSSSGISQAIGQMPMRSPAPPIFGLATASGAPTPVFGQTSKVGASAPSLGTTAPATTSAFGGFGAVPASNPFTFGLAPPGASPTMQEQSAPQAATSIFGQSPTFGSGTGMLSFGTTFGASFNRPTFGALASETKDSPGFLKDTVITTGAIPDPFGAFGSLKSHASGTGMIARPLFGSPPVPNKLVSDYPFEAFGANTSSSSKSGMATTPLFGSQPFEGIATVAPMEPTKLVDPDYASILTKFYEKDYPEKLKDIPKLLKKFKGKEAEMFAKIAKTYGVLNPLDAITEQAVSKSKEPEVEPSTHRGIQEETDDFPGAKAAAEAFDTLDDEKAGQLPIERFEDLLEELGEGFHGEEFDAQLKMVDPDGSNSIHREAFIKWYCGLISADEGYADQEIDEDELEEREEERQRVLAVFKVFSTDDGKSINLDLFPKFMKKIGTTYAEEVHGKAAKRMEGPPGSIAWKAFDAWYIPWLFEGDDETDEETEGEVDRGDESVSGRSAVADGWGGIFGKPKGWKCAVCMIQNEEDKKKCASCETVRPGFEADAAKQGTAIVAAPGTSSFSFGVPSASALPASSTLSFGGSTQKPQASSGFSFGAPPVSDSSPLKAPVSSSFTFGVAQGIKVDSQSAFGFGVATGDKTAPEGSFASGAPASDTKTTKPSSTVPAPVSGYPPMSSKAPSNPFGSSKLRDTAKQDSSKTTAMPVSATPAPGFGYPPMSSKAPSNPFGSSTTNTAKADSSNEPNYGALLMTVYQDHDPSKIPDIPALLKKYKGKEVTMFGKVAKKYGIMNPLDTAVPSAHPSSTLVLSGNSNAAIPEMPTKTPLRNFPLASMSSLPIASESPFGALGLSNATTTAVASSVMKPLFGSSPAKAIPEKNLPESLTHRDIQEETDDFPGAEAAAEAFDTLDDEKAGQLPIERFEDLLEELGEGFHGEEFDAQLKMVDPDGSNSIHREAFIKWYCGLISADEGYADQEIDEDELEEREEERQRVLAVFKVFSTDDGKSINLDLFPKFMKKIGTTYAEEVHGKAAKRMEGPPGSIAWKAFDAWYIPWLFEGDDETDEETEGEVDRGDESVSGRSAVADGWGGIFGKPKGWKCAVCMIQNEEDKKKCASCETVRPGFEADAAKQGTAIVAAPGTSSFSFGVPSASALPASSTLSFGGSTQKPQASSGFSFGAPPVSDSSPLKAPVSSSFTFGVAQGIKVDSQSAFGFGVATGDKTAPEGSFASGAPASDTKTTKPSSTVPAPVSGYPPMSSKAPSNPFGSSKLRDTAKQDSSKTTAMPVSATPAPAFGYPPMSSKAPSNPFGSSTTNTAKADSSNEPNYGALLMTVYQDHDPSKIPDIPALLKKYKGKEVTMFGKVAKKYGIMNPLDTAVPSPSGLPVPNVPTNSFTGFVSADLPPPESTTTSFSGLPPSTAPPLVPFAKSIVAESFLKPAMPTASSGYPPLSLSAPTNPFGKTSNPAPLGNSRSSRFVATPAVTVASFGHVLPSASAPVASQFHTASSPLMTNALTGSIVSSSAQSNNQTDRQITSGSSARLNRPVSKFEEQFVDAMQAFQESIQSLRQQSPAAVDTFEKDLRALIANREKMWNYLFDFDSEAATHRQRCVFLLSRIPDLERQMGEAQRLIRVHKKSQPGQNGTASTQALDADSEVMRRRLAAEAIMIPRLVDIVEGGIRLLEAVQHDRVATSHLIATGKEALLETVKNVTDLSSVINSASSRCYSKIVDKSKKVPRTWDENAWKSPEPKVRNGRRGIIRNPNVESKLKTSPQGSEFFRECRPSNLHKWQRIEQLFHVTRADTPSQSRIVLAAPLLKFKRERISTSHSISVRTGQKSLLLSPPQFEKSTGGNSSGTSIAADLFFVPTNSLVSRSDWDAGFTTDQMKVRNLSFNLPRHLNEVKSSDAVRESLAQYGTTPEKLAKVMESKARAAAASKTVPDEATPKHPPTHAKTLPSSLAGLPATPTRDSGAFAPNSLSESAVPFLNPPKSSGYPLAGTAPTISGSDDEPSGPPSKSQRKPEKIDSSPFGGMQSLGAALFPAAAPASSGGVFAASKEPNLSKAAATNKPDYQALLTKFYETHNPEKIKDVSKHLDRYKGKEAEMFGKLAQRYKTTNPLDTASLTSSAAPTTSFGAPGGATKQFGAMPGSSTFGLTTSTAPIGAKQSPFGNAPSPAVPSPFGSTTPANTPFGDGSPRAGPTPFGSASSTFGNSTVSSSHAAPAPAFGSAVSPNTAFGMQSQAPISSPFATAQSTPFGTAVSSAPTPFGGKSNRELLVAFYQQYNASKLSDVDMVLQKYKGQEEKLFRNLAHKYKLDPSVFGLSQPTNPSATTSAFAGGFGQASQLGGGNVFGGGTTSPALGFGTTSALSTSGTFGTGGFGSTQAPSATGFGASGGFGSSATAQGFGSHSSFGNTPSVGGFGSLAQQGGGGFGTPASGGFSAGATPFGGSPFGAPRR